ncbi:MULTISPECIES: DUF2269 family protein [unclassified Nitrospina]|uniref:DUF2269 family protein n=1 Tax=unclassified Nitrospina TaxID=2638683 RepID=UPI003F949DFE
MSAVVLLGTGLGLAFMLFRAQQSRNSQTLLFALNNTLIGDIVFIGPALFVLFGSGHWMLGNGGHWQRGYRWYVYRVCFYSSEEACKPPR